MYHPSDTSCHSISLGIDHLLVGTSRDKGIKGNMHTLQVATSHENLVVAGHWPASLSICMSRADNISASASKFVVQLQNMNGMAPDAESATMSNFSTSTLKLHLCNFV